MNKKIIFILFFTLLPFILKAEQSNYLNNYIGCYEAIYIDGLSITPGPLEDRSLTRIESHTSTIFFDHDKEPLETLMIVFFMGYDNHFYRYHSFILFPEMGDTFQENFETFHSFSDNILMKNWHRFDQVDHNIYLRLKKEQDDILKGEVTFFSSKREMNGHRDFKLQKVDCP